MEQAEYEARKQALIEEITAAFDGVELEDGVSFHETHVRDSYRIEDRNHEMRVEARAKDTETRWQGVPDELIAHHSDAVLNFLDPKGFRYYIPAFLLWYLQAIDSEEMFNEFGFSNSDTFSSVDYQLQGGSEKQVNGFYLEKFSILNQQQSQAIAHFVQFQIMRREKHDADFDADAQAGIERGEVTQEQVNEWLKQKKRSNRLFNHSEQALKRYWGLFL